MLNKLKIYKPLKKHAELKNKIKKFTSLRCSRLFLYFRWVLISYFSRKSSIFKIHKTLFITYPSKLYFILIICIRQCLPDLLKWIALVYVRFSIFHSVWFSGFVCTLSCSLLNNASESVCSSYIYFLYTIIIKKWKSSLYFFGIFPLTVDTYNFLTSAAIKVLSREKFAASLKICLLFRTFRKLTKNYFQKSIGFKILCI